MPIVRSVPQPPAVMIVEEATPEERAANLARQEHFMRNVRWFETNVADLRAKYAGQYVTIAGGEAFADPDVKTSRAQARAAHPEDEGVYLTQYFRPAGRVT